MNPNSLTTMRRKPTAFYLLLVFVGLALFGALTYANYKFASEINSSVDFLHRWLPTRLVFFDDYSDIYGDDVSLQIQMVRYGRPAIEGEKPGLFAYPYYTVFLFLPFAAISNYALSLSLFLSIVEIAHLAIFLVVLRILNFHPPKSTFVLLCLFALFSADMISSIVYGNPVSFSALFSVLSLYFLQLEKDEAAGIFLALATFKPQSIFFFFVLIWLWTFSHRRWEVIYASVLTIIVLFGISFAFQPDWLSGFVKQVLWYPKVASPNSPESILRGFNAEIARYISRGLSIASIITLLIEWIKAYKKDFNHLLWVVGLTFSILPLSGIPSTKNNLVLALPAVVIIIATIGRRQQGKMNWMNVTLLLSFIIGWVALYLARTLTILLPNSNVTNLDLLVFPVLLITGLYLARKPFLTTTNQSS